MFSAARWCSGFVGLVLDLVALVAVSASFSPGGFFLGCRGIDSLDSASCSGRSTVFAVGLVGCILSSFLFFFCFVEVVLWALFLLAVDIDRGVSCIVVGAPACFLSF